MTPEERQRLANLEQTVSNLQRVTDVNFIENIKRRLGLPGIITNLRVNDLFDVDTDGISNGQVLKWNSTENKYLPQNDNI